MKYCLLAALSLVFLACGDEGAMATRDPAAGIDDATVEDPKTGSATAQAAYAEERLDAVLAAQSDETKARYQYRHPKETMQFFGVKPGMTVVDSLPGEPGWYAPILLSYLGSDGKLIGADYSMEMWPLFTDFATEEFLKARQSWMGTYAVGAEAVRGEDGAAVGAFVYGSAPEDLAETVDVVLMFRAAHHFNRLENGRFFTEALEEIKMMLKPGGVVGVVQHRAAESADDRWANGDNGYVKQSRIISVLESAGFELVETSEINVNPQDQPTQEEYVWRLPPTLEDEDLRAEMEAIGESDRMTLKFRKPE